MSPVRGALWAILLLVAGCGGGAPETPSATVEAFLDAMDRASVDQQALARAFELLAKPAREGLEERAAKAQQLGGRVLEPWQMLVQGRFRLRFSPTSMRERIDGDQAVVTVVGEDAGQRAEIPLIREDGRWKLVLQLGPMQRGQLRTGGSTAPQ